MMSEEVAISSIGPFEVKQYRVRFAVDAQGRLHLRTQQPDEDWSDVIIVDDSEIYEVSFNVAVTLKGQLLSNGTQFGVSEPCPCDDDVLGQGGHHEADHSS